MTTLALNPATGQYIEAGNTPRVGQMTITPDQAAAILNARNTHNRTISPTVVAKYARDMTNGDWLLNGDAIRFAADGTLLDGQHRLAAIVKSGATIRTVVVWNLPAEAQATMDDGRKRTMANVLELSGQRTSAKTVASILRRAILWERGVVVSGGASAPTKAEMQQYLNDHPEVTDAAVLADHIRNTRGVKCAASTLGLAYYLFSAKSKTAADEFFDKLRTGAGLEEGNPILVLRNRLALDGSTRLATESPEVLAWFIKAWNAWRKGRTIKVLRFKAGETFPEPK